MAIKMNIGICKKIGLPEYGSAGSHCDLELEVDVSTLNEPQKFHAKVQQAYALCRAAVEEELQNHRSGTAVVVPEQQVRTSANRNPAPMNNAPASNGRASFGPSAKQREYIQRLAGQVKGFSNQKLERLCEQMYKKSFTALSGLEASNLIDTLREVKAGRLDLSAI